jgi:phosphoglycolate phosphatase
MSTTIIWDWNGTLLNDLDLCIACINTLLKKRELPLLDRASYKEVFSFPVKDYYKAIGFNFSKEDFAIPAREFIDLYDIRVENCSLHSSTEEVLRHFKGKGFRQFVLSAMKQSMLEKTLKHNGIFSYFKAVAGLSDHYAVSKIDRGRQLLDDFNIE